MGCLILQLPMSFLYNIIFNLEDMGVSDFDEKEIRQGTHMDNFSKCENG